MMGAMIKKAVFQQASPVASTWYTILNVSSGSGFFNSALIYSGNFMQNLFLRITIDGTLTVVPDYTSNFQSLSYTVVDTEARKSRAYLTKLRFESSLKVEISTNTNTFPLNGFADYTLDE